MPINARPAVAARQDQFQGVRMTSAILAFLGIIAIVFIFNSAFMDDTATSPPSQQPVKDQCFIVTKRLDSSSTEFRAIGDPCGTKAGLARITRHLKDEVRKLGDVCSVQCLVRQGRGGEWFGYSSTGPLGQFLWSEWCGVADQPGCGERTGEEDEEGGGDVFIVEV